MSQKHGRRNFQSLPTFPEGFNANSALEVVTDVSYDLLNIYTKCIWTPGKGVVSFTKVAVTDVN